MCGLFVSTCPLSAAAQVRVTHFVQRRGTLPIRWHTMRNGCVLAHSLLPIRGRAPRHQPAVGRMGVLAFTGELWEVPQNRSDTDVVLARLESVGPKKAFRSFDGNWAIVYVSNHDGCI